MSDQTEKQESAHLALWERVKTTPPSATKNANINGQKITSIDTMHLIHLATAQFGPMGIGWGYEIEDERIDEGAPIFSPKGDSIIGHELTHTIKLSLWYKWGGEKGQVSQFGHTRYVYKTSKGTFMTDNEAPKKSLSDAMKKCLSLLGFAADVFTGLFDDNTYVQARRTEESISKADDAEAEIQKYRDEFTDWVNRHREMLRNKIPYKRSIKLALDQALARLPDKASLARVEHGRAAQQLRDAAQEGFDRLDRQRQEAQQDQHSEQVEEQENV